MSQNSLRSNFLFTFLYKLTMLLFPLVTFPYASRILGPEGIGQVNFAKSFSQYFIMIATLGIPIYGIREIAKRRDDLPSLKKTFTQLIVLSSVFALFSSALYFFLVFSIPRFASSRVIFSYFGISIFLSVFTIDWFFNGLEAFQKVAIRSVIVKVVSIAGLLLLVKTKEDTDKYALIFVLLYLGDSLLNCIMSWRYLDFSFKAADLKAHLKPVILFSVLSVSTTVFQNLDSVMLGFLDSDISVGLYNSAIKINRIIIVLVTTITTVLIPRLSYYKEKNQMKEFYETIQKSVSGILFVAVPSAAGLILLAREILLLFSGSGFLSAGNTMIVLSALIPIVGISQMLSLQILIPMNEEKMVLRAYVLGAAVNFILNLVLIPIYSNLGAALATLTSELSLCLFLLIMVSYKKRIKILSIKHLIYPLASLLFLPVVFYLGKLNLNPVFLVLLSVGICFFLYGTALTLLKESTAMHILSLVKKKVGKI
ncbi:MAG: flippase [Spirochaetales bacterium]|nr:flippase [Spirochaetales bacterium]